MVTRPMTCPRCQQPFTSPAAQVREIGVCPHCGASFVVEGERLRLATAADSTILTAAELDTLKKARNRR